MNAEVKTGLKFSIMVQNLDIHYLRGHHSSNSNSIASKVLTKGTTAKELWLKECNAKKTKLANEKALALPWTNVAKSLEQGKKNRKDKKWRFREHKRDYVRKERILSTSVNAN